MAGNWELINGAWVAKSKHNTGTEPVSRGIDFAGGKAPGYVIKLNGVENRRRENLRKFDKPNETQINALMKADDEERAKERDITPIIRESKKDLESGKLRVSPDVLNERDKRVVPFASVVDSRGITHVLPIHKVPEEEAPSKLSIEQKYEQLKKELAIERASVQQIGSPHNVNVPSHEPNVDQKTIIDNAMDAVRRNRDQTRGRTI